MPLSQPVAGRESVHTRRIELQGYARDDGLFDIEAWMTDTKSDGFSTGDRWVEPGEALHGMAMRMTVDQDMVIVGFEAVMDNTPYRICPGIAPNFAKLVGLAIGKGFLRAAAERVGGTHGCTHLRELLQQLATVAFQTIYPRLRRKETASVPARPPLLNTCYTYRADGPVVQAKWPDHYTGAQLEPVSTP
jgi:hypothetical protein